MPPIFDVGALTVTPAAYHANTPDRSDRRYSELEHVRRHFGELGVRALVDRHAAGEFGEDGAFAPPTDADRALGDDASRPARNSISIADGRGEVVSRYPFPQPAGKPPVVLVVRTAWTLGHRNPMKPPELIPSTHVRAESDHDFRPA